MTPEEIFKIKEFKNMALFLTHTIKTPTKIQTIFIEKLVERSLLIDELFKNNI